ncbi:MAG: PAS domain S-box protein, partial [bacterium]
MEKIRVLYIEDDDTQRKSLSGRLRSEGFKVTVSKSGQIGLHLFKRRTFDVILCDLNMPGLGGIEVLENVRRINADIPFIILTAHGTVSLAVKAIKKDADHFILKPAEINEIIITINQVIEKRKLQKELHDSETSLKMLMENVPDVIYSLNPKGEFISLSPAVETILSYKPSELIGTSVFNIIHPDDRERIRTGFIQAAKSGKEQIRTVEFRMVSKTGEVKYFEVRGRSVVENDQVVKSDGIARDVSKRKYLEEELKKYSHGLEKKAEELENNTYLLGRANVELLSIKEQLEEKNTQMENLLKELSKNRDELQIVLDTTPDVIVMIDNEGKIVTANKRVDDFFGIKIEE